MILFKNSLLALLRKFKLSNFERYISPSPLISTGISLKSTKKSNSHPIFTKFLPFEGMVSSSFDVGHYGSLIRRSFYSQPNHESDRRTKECLPPVNEEYFEWIDLLESIDSARESFTMVELGAGYGRWLVSAAVILRNQKNIPFKLIGVEAESNHYKMMNQHFIDNGLNPKDHTLIHAAVTDTERTVYFTDGHSKEWWGQEITTANNIMQQFPDAKVEEIQGCSITTILKNTKFVDFMDIDIQGEELKAIRGSIETLNNKVKRIHIGIHSHKIAKTLFKLFSEMGWKCYDNLHYNSTLKTQYGEIIFQDGVQTWINPNI